MADENDYTRMWAGVYSHMENPAGVFLTDDDLSYAREESSTGYRSVKNERFQPYLGVWDNRPPHYATVNSYTGRPTYSTPPEQNRLARMIDDPLSQTINRPFCPTMRENFTPKPTQTEQVLPILLAQVAQLAQTAQAAQADNKVLIVVLFFIGFIIIVLLSAIFIRSFYVSAPARTQNT